MSKPKIHRQDIAGAIRDEMRICAERMCGLLIDSLAESAEIPIALLGKRFIVTARFNRDTGDQTDPEERKTEAG